MFRRLLLENWMVLFTIVAFITASSVYVSIFYRALRMRRSQVQRMAALPFSDEPVSRPHE
jgi:hypothetical protein